MKFNEALEEILNEGSVKSMENISKYILDEFVNAFAKGDAFHQAGVDNREKWARKLIAFVNHRFSKYIEGTDNIFGYSFVMNNMQMLAYKLYLYARDNDIGSSMSSADKKKLIKLITDFILTPKKSFYNDFA